MIALIAGGTVFFMFSAPQTDIMNVFLKPIQSIVNSASGFVSDTVNTFTNTKAIEQENKELKEKLAKSNYDLTDYESVKRRLEFYEDYLKIKNENSSFEFQPAVIIGRDTAQPFGTVTINAGLSAGIAQYDPVIT